MKVEVCSYSLESCLNAQEAGASRIELCSGLGEGGTTPSTGLIRTVKRHIQIPVYVMIRPRGGDFIYSDLELEVMLADIQSARDAGADGLVFGALTADGQVDRAAMDRLKIASGSLGITFHRAFDLTKDPFTSLEEIIASGAERILTSGQQNTAPLGISLLHELCIKADNRIEIMAGSGVSAANAADLIAAGVHALHLTGKSFRTSTQKYRPYGVSMAGEQPDEFAILFSDRNKIQRVVELAGNPGL